MTSCGKRWKPQREAYATISSANANGNHMLREVSELQHVLGMSDGELLILCRRVAGCDQIRSVHDLIGCELLELLEDLRGMAEIAGLVGMAT